MGTKGTATTNTTQNQTYAPAGAGYVQNALNQAQSAAQLPFNIPQAPVAGFSPFQQQAFGQIQNAQGIANPYFQQAANQFNTAAQGPNISNFFNPYSQAVLGNLQDIFGQQMSQATGTATQQAGGTGADRIAVAQANLAKQQGLAAGQTLSGLYQPALSAALQEQGQQQQLGQNYANLGLQAQNASLQGSNALLGAGNQQQQLQQAQMNAPYQQQLAQAAFPYQQAQFLASITGALAPGLGGTSYGTGTSQSTPAQPSIWSQLLGGGMAGAGLLGQSGAFGGQGWLTGSSPSYGGGNAFSGDAYGGSGSNPLPGLTMEDYGPGYAHGGPINPYAEGGPVSDQPIDVSKGFVPQEQLHPIQTQMPHLNLSAPAGGGQQSGGGFGDILKTGIQLAGMFMHNGGAVLRNPYADGGDVDIEDRFGPTKDAIASGMFDPQGINSTTFEGMPGMVASNARNVPLPAARPADAPAVEDDDESVPTDVSAQARPAAMGNPYQVPAAPPRDHDSFAESPWSALTAAGLGIMGGSSPFAGVNIGQGGMQGLKMLETQREQARKDETTDQAAQRLQMEAQQHQDAMTKMTPYQQAQIGIAKAKLAKDEGDTSVKDIVDAIESGDQSPSLTGLYGKSAAVRAEASRRGIPLAKMQTEWAAAQRQIASLNGSQMQRFIGLSNSVTNTIDEVKALSQELHNSGIPIINRAKIAATLNTEANTPRGQLAQRYLTSINTLKSEFANLEAGGFAPHESVWQLANQQISGDFGEKQLGAALDEIQRLVKYRINAIPNIGTLGPGATNRYTGQQQPAQAAPAGKAPVVYQGGHEYHLQPDGSYQ